MKLGIYGSGGLGREIYEIARRRNELTSRWGEIIFVDDFRREGPYFGTKVISLASLITSKTEYECIVAVGEPSSRKIMLERLLCSGINITKLIDPTAVVSPACELAEGVVICEYATIHCGAQVGLNSLVQPFCLLGHNVKVGKHSVLSAFCAPGGGVVIGNRVFVGLQCSIKESLTVGDDAIIAMGSVVFNDVPSGSTVVGNPARITKGSTDRKVFASTR